MGIYVGAGGVKTVNSLYVGAGGVKTVTAVYVGAGGTYKVWPDEVVLLDPSNNIYNWRTWTMTSTPTSSQTSGMAGWYIDGEGIYFQYKGGTQYSLGGADGQHYSCRTDDGAFDFSQISQFTSVTYYYTISQTIANSWVRLSLTVQTVEDKTTATSLWGDTGFDPGIGSTDTDTCHYTGDFVTTVPFSYTNTSAHAWWIRYNDADGTESNYPALWQPEALVTKIVLSI